MVVVNEEIKLRVKSIDREELWLYRNDDGDWLLEIEAFTDEGGVCYVTIPAKELWNELAANIAEE